jgi:SAM-dependent methyltransferase
MTGREDERADPRSFDHLPLVFDRFAELVGGPLRDHLLACLPAQGGRALDLGCGAGQHAVLLAGRHAEVLAVDVSAPMLDLARRTRPHPDVRYELRDLREVTPAADGTFDLVFTAYTLHHLPDLQRALSGIRGLVRPGGQAIVVDNVDERRRVPRDWFVREARRALLADLRHRRRSVREAWETYRLSTHPAWLDHLTTDTFLPPGEWERIARSVFPGCEITPMYRARAVRWRDPR